MAYADILRSATYGQDDIADLIDGLIPNIQNQSYTYLGTTTGSASLAGSASQAPSAYADGQMFLFNAGYTNSGSATLNCNSLGAVTIYDNDTRAALVGGEIVANSIYAVVYRSGFFYLLNATSGAWISFATTHTGFSVNPTHQMHYKKEGRTVTVAYRCSGHGTSNATNYLISLPFTARTLTNMVWWCSCPYAVDSGAAINTAIANLSSGSASLELLKSAASPLWTNSGNKSANLTFIYEAAS